MLVSIRSEGVQIVINTVNLTSVLIGSYVWSIREQMHK